MSSSKLNNNLQILASLAVVAGLILVAYEVRQNNVLARAGAVREVLMSWQPVHAAGFETDIAALNVKSLAEPENLTPDEIHRLSHQSGYGNEPVHLGKFDGQTWNVIFQRGLHI